MLTHLAEKVFKNAEAHGFWDEYNSIMQKVTISSDPGDGTALFSQQDIDAIKFAFSCQRLMLIVSELGEMVEAKRLGKTADWVSYEKALSGKGVDFDPELFKQFIKDSPEDEFADSVIRHMDMAGGEKIDIAKHVAHKMKYNAQREKLHGKKF